MSTQLAIQSIDEVSTTLQKTAQYRTKAGGFIKLVDFAVLSGTVITKENKKALQKAHDGARKEFNRTNKQMAAVISADPLLQVRNVAMKLNAKGEYVGFNVTHRVPTKAEEAREAKAIASDKDALNAKLAAEMAELKAELARLKGEATPEVPTEAVEIAVEVVE